MQPTSADVLMRAVDLEGDVRDRLDAVPGELEFDAFGLQEFGVLLGEGVFGLGEDAEEVVRVRSVSSTRMGKRP